MNISQLYYRLSVLSPRIEIILRKLYWRNVIYLKKFKPEKKAIVLADKKSSNPTDFDAVIDYLKSIGVGKGSLLIIHSAFSPIKQSGLSAQQIIDKLLQLIGPEGTLAMPVIRKFAEDPVSEKILTTDMSQVCSTYDVANTPITSGYLAATLMKYPGSCTSRFPLNPMTALGPLAEQMMLHNLDGENLSPHGPNSSWKFCLDHDAIVLGIGVDLARCITITHVAEEAFPGWYFRDWYRSRTFKIIDGDFVVTKTVLERQPRWGMLHYAENNLKKDLLNNNVLKIANPGGILTCSVVASEYISFLRSRNRTGYPYLL